MDEFPSRACRGEANSNYTQNNHARTTVGVRGCVSTSATNDVSLGCVSNAPTTVGSLGSTAVGIIVACRLAPVCPTPVGSALAVLRRPWQPRGLTEVRRLNVVA